MLARASGVERDSIWETCLTYPVRPKGMERAQSAVEAYTTWAGACRLRPEFTFIIFCSFVLGIIIYSI
jgi:hypothetical protein